MVRTAQRILHYRNLLLTLTGRELKARYRGTALGFFWSLVNPLLLLGVYSLVFGVVFRPRMEVPGPYVLFLTSGLFPWIFVSASLLEGTTSITVNGGLVKKALFPMEILPLVSLLTNLVHLVLALPILGIGLLIARLMGYRLASWSVVLLPGVVALEVFLVAGLVLGLAAMNVHFKDTKDVISHLLTLTFFLAPILYPLGSVPYPALRALIQLNPFTSFTLAYQELLYFGGVPPLALWGQMIAVGLLGWALGAWLFERLSETLAEAV